MEGNSEEIFSEGLAELSEGQEVTTRMRETEMWSKYISWCEERYSDKNVSDTLREKVSGEYLLFVILPPASLSLAVSFYSGNCYTVFVLLTYLSIIHSVYRYRDFSVAPVDLK